MIRKLEKFYEFCYNNNMVKFCNKCKKDKLLKYFGLNKAKKDGRQGTCKNCRKIYDAESYQMRSIFHKNLVKTRKRKILVYNAKKFLEYFKNNPCIDCGEKDPTVLEFDHVRGIKSKNISLMWKESWEKILQEIEKCDVRCANCHRRITAKRIGSIRSYWETL